MFSHIIRIKSKSFGNNVILKKEKKVTDFHGGGPEVDSAPSLTGAWV